MRSLNEPGKPQISAWRSLDTFRDGSVFFFFLSSSFSLFLSSFFLLLQTISTYRLVQRAEIADVVGAVVHAALGGGLGGGLLGGVFGAGDDERGASSAERQRWPGSSSSSSSRRRARGERGAAGSHRGGAQHSELEDGGKRDEGERERQKNGESNEKKTLAFAWFEAKVREVKGEEKTKKPFDFAPLSILQNSSLFPPPSALGTCLCESFLLPRYDG